MVSEPHFSATIDADTLPCALLYVNDNGIITGANSYLCAMLCYPKAELIDQPVEMILTVSTKIFYQTHFYPLVKLHGKVEEVFLSLNDKNGQSLPVIAFANRTGNSNCYVFVSASQRRKYEDELLKAKRAAESANEQNLALIELKNTAEMQLVELEKQLRLSEQFNREYVELSNILAHDLHEPIRKLMLRIDILITSGSITPEETERSLSLMMRYCSRLRELTLCLQQFVNIDNIREPVQKIYLEQLLNAVYDRVAAAQKTDAILRLEEMPALEGYPTLLDALFTELFTNSFKFRRHEIPLNIRVISTEFSDNIYKTVKEKYRYIDFVRIDIEDNGEGFPDEYSTYVFGLFKRVNLEKDGSGFGLALCKKIVERHKGSISASSANGRTVFSVVLPVRQNQIDE